MTNIDSYLSCALDFSLSKGRQIIVSFQNTSTPSFSEPSEYLLPPRSCGDYLIIGICNPTYISIDHFFKILSSNILYVLVDLDIKSLFSPNPSFPHITTINSYLKTFYSSYNTHYFSANTLTIQSVLRRLLYHSDSFEEDSIAISGLGKIGSKLALILNDFKANIIILTSNWQKAKSLESIASLTSSGSSKLTVCENYKYPSIHFDTLLLCTPSAKLRDIIDLNSIPTGTHIISLSPIALTDDEKNFFKNHQITMEYVCVDIELIMYVNYVIDSHAGDDFKPKRCKLGSQYLVSGGYPASPNDYVVDNADSPSFILGRIDNCGKFVREFSAWP